MLRNLSNHAENSRFDPWQAKNIFISQNDEDDDNDDVKKSFKRCRKFQVRPMAGQKYFYIDLRFVPLCPLNVF